MKFGKIIILYLTLSAIAACSNSPEWVDIGGSITNLKNNEPEKIREIPYRLFNLHTQEGEIKKTTDIVDIKLAIQSGRARGKLVMIAFRTCWSPNVRDGIPTVICSAESTGDVYLAGDEKIRSKLLHLKEGKQIGNAVGLILGMHGGNPVILVL